MVPCRGLHVSVPRFFAGCGEEIDGREGLALELVESV
jgi:hypothetical protein